MSTNEYSVTLNKGVDKEQFLNNHSDCDCCHRSENIPRLCYMNLTDDEAATLRADPDVLSVSPIPDMAMAKSPSFVNTRVISNKIMLGWEMTPSSLNSGEDYITNKFRLTTDIEINNPPLGDASNFPGTNDTSSPEGTFQYFAGENVDIVTQEVSAAGQGTYYPVESHPEFYDEFSQSTRFVRMDWSTYDSRVTSVYNNQITNNNPYCWNHPMGVLSCAAGRYNGWAKNSSIRLANGDDFILYSMEAILNWHISKPVNPTTGVRNATVVIGEHQWYYDLPIGIIPVDLVNQISSYNPTTNLLETVNRPGGGWGGDYSEFVRLGHVPVQFEDPSNSSNYIWGIFYGSAGFPFGNNNRWADYDAILDAYNTEGDIFHFKACGNQTFTAAGESDPQFNNQVSHDAGTIYTMDNNSQTAQTYSATAVAAGSKFTHRSWENGGDFDITIGAAQGAEHSERSGVIPDYYSNRGGQVDLWCQGSGSWSAYPVGITYSDGFQWGNFGGTSAATPQAVGVGVVVLEWWLSMYGTWPTMTELKNLLIELSEESAGDKVFEPQLNVSNTATVFDWANAGAATTQIRGTVSPNWPSQNSFLPIHRLNTPFNVYGSFEMLTCESSGTTNNFAMLPWRIARWSGQNIKVGSQQPREQVRPSDGQMYPRRKINRT